MIFVAPNDLKLDAAARHRLVARFGKDFELLGPDDTFNFTCSQCTRCCKNRSDHHRFDKLLLAPYDIIRMSRRLDITTTKFIEQHAGLVACPQTQSMELYLKFNGDDYNNVCPFLENNQCSIYNDRPMGCRLYPLGRVFDNNNFSILLPKSHKECALGTGKKWVIRDWLEQMDLFHYFKYDRPWHLLNRIDHEKFNQLPSSDRDYFFRNLYDMDSGGIFLNKDGKLPTPEETTLIVCEFCEYFLKELGCLDSTSQ